MATTQRANPSRLSEELLIRSDDRVLVVNAPGGYLEALKPLPVRASFVEPAGGDCDVVQLFAHDRAELETHAAVALDALKPGGVLWMCYPNSAQLAEIPDLSRDHGWGLLHERGLVATTVIELDDAWCAQRFRPNAELVAAGDLSQAIPPADLLPVGRRATIAYRLVRVIGIPLLHLVFGFRFHGRENIPRTGTYIAISNHLSWLDSFLILITFPIEPRIHFLADPTGLLRRRLQWWLVRATGGYVPVNRATHHDAALFDHVYRCLELGGAIALFPEANYGPREGELLPFKKGFAHFAVTSGVPVVPVALSGAKDLWFRKRIEVYVGEPIAASGRPVDEVYEAGCKAVAELLPRYVESTGPKLFRRWLTALF
jgi:1-acyl-sn-glycerol-3-phosphate acyltransferase